jgi:accessory gene regulator B
LSYLSFSRNWARCLAANTGISPEKETIITFGIEVLVLNLVNVVLTLLLGLLMGVLPLTAACLATVALFRHTAGGAHASSPWRCAIITILIFPALALLATYLAHFGHIFSITLSAIAIMLGLAAIVALAPVDNPAAPIISTVRRKRLKALSFIVLLFIIAIIVALGQTGWGQASAFRNGLSLSILWVSFILTRTGHHAFAYLDSVNFTLRRR